MPVVKNFQLMEAKMEEGYTNEGYYQACVNGTWIVFVSYEEYVEYTKD